MVYKYFSKNNFEDLSSGKILFHKSKYTNYPVRLAGEIFSQCLEHTNKINNLIVYDPCCGSGYLLTILGLLFNEKIEKIFASDISEEAINLTIEPFPKPRGSDNKILDHPQGSQAEDSGE